MTRRLVAALALAITAAALATLALAIAFGPAIAALLTAAAGAWLASDWLTDTDPTDQDRTRR